jgi:hypothetical protein
MSFAQNPEFVKPARPLAHQFHNLSSAPDLKDGYLSEAFPAYII